MGSYIKVCFIEALPGGVGSYVACLNFKTSLVGVYKCLSLIVGFAVTVAIWPREVVSCRDFILRAVATFWAMSPVGIYPGRASLFRYIFFGLQVNGPIHVTVVIDHSSKIIIIIIMMMMM